MAKKFGPVTVDKVEKSAVTGFFQAQLRQVVEETYGRSAGNNKVRSFFTDADFGDALPSTTYTTTRVAWINVPPESASVEAIEALLAKHPKSRIYRVLSFDAGDVLTEGQLIAFDSDPERYLVKDADGEIVLDSVYRMPMYRQSFFDATGELPDEDHRRTSAQRLGFQAAAPVSAEEFDKLAGNPFN